MEKDSVEFGKLKLHPVKTQRASEAIYEQIKDIIINRQLKPGDRLPSERAMMENFQRSRPIIREALRMLEQAGFIRAFAGSHGAVVQELSTNSVGQPLESMFQIQEITLEELSEYRSFTDSVVAELAAKRRTDKDVEMLTELLIKAEKSVDNYKDFSKYDREFHELLAKAANNKVALIMTRVTSRAVLGLIEEKMEKLNSSDRHAMYLNILSMHKKIAEAVEKGDAETARKEMETHIKAFGQDLKD